MALVTKNYVIQFVPTPMDTMEIYGLKRMRMVLVPNRSGFVTDSTGIEYYIDQLGTVKRLTKKENKKLTRRNFKNEG